MSLATGVVGMMTPDPNSFIPISVLPTDMAAILKVSHTVSVEVHTISGSGFALCNLTREFLCWIIRLQDCLFTSCHDYKFGLQVMNNCSFQYHIVYMNSYECCTACSLCIVSLHVLSPSRILTQSEALQLPSMAAMTGSK